jgi:hypothetical protein
MDLHGGLGRPGRPQRLQGVNVRYRIDADATLEEIKALAVQSLKLFAVYDI